MRIEFCIVIQYHDVTADPDAKRQAEALLATPADPAFCVARLAIVEVFRAAVRTVNDRIAEAHHGSPPLALADPPVLRVGNSLVESANEQIPQKLRVKRPE